MVKRNKFSAKAAEPPRTERGYYFGGVVGTEGGAALGTTTAGGAEVIPAAATG